MYVHTKKVYANMDKIEEFEIELDIHDRTRIYDYATSTEIRREPNKKWKQEQFQGIGNLDQIPEDDENRKVQVRIMDKAIVDSKGFFQKERTTDQVNDDQNYFGSIYDGLPSKISLPRRALPVYHPGDVVTGRVLLKLKEPVQADKFSVCLLGRAKTNIRVYHRYGYYDHTNYETYVEQQSILWEKSENKEDFDVFTDTFSLVKPSSEPQRSKQLGAGMHTFPFEFTIPLEAAQSTPNLRQDQASHCYIMYRVKAELDSGKCFGRGDVVLHKGIWVEKPYDIGKEPANLQPITNEETLDAGVLIKSGKLTLRAALPGSAFVKSKCIPITIELDNQSSTEAKTITARIGMIGRLKRKPDSTSCIFIKKIDIKGKKVSTGPIASGMSPQFKLDLPWDFSESSVDGYLMPVGTLEDCGLIEVRYAVFIEVKRPGLHRNMSMEIPITIGTVNSASHDITDSPGGSENRLYPELNIPKYSVNA